jgi:hypothetical protein
MLRNTAICTFSCPRRRYGKACQLSLAPSSTTEDFIMSYNNASALSGGLASNNSFASCILFFLVFMVAMVAVFMIMRGCFCDCFGGFRNPFKTVEERPIDPQALNRCLDAVRVYEQNEKNRYSMESRRPLISSVSEGCAPYNPPVLAPGQYDIYPPAPSAPSAHAGVLPRINAPTYPQQPSTQQQHRSCSPPPSYRSRNGSVEYLPGMSANTKL